MAETPERNGEIRAVNYVDGSSTVIRFRIEQFWDGTWTPIKVYLDTGAGNLQEIKQ